MARFPLLFGIIAVIIIRSILCRSESPEIFRSDPFEIGDSFSPLTTFSGPFPCRAIINNSFTKEESDAFIDSPQKPCGQSLSYPCTSISQGFELCVVTGTVILELVQTGIVYDTPCIISGPSEITILGLLNDENPMPIVVSALSFVGINVVRLDNIEISNCHGRVGLYLTRITRADIHNSVFRNNSVSICYDHTPLSYHDNSSIHDNVTLSIQNSDFIDNVDRDFNRSLCYSSGMVSGVRSFDLFVRNVYIARDDFFSFDIQLEGRGVFGMYWEYVVLNDTSYKSIQVDSYAYDNQITMKYVEFIHSSVLTILWAQEESSAPDDPCCQKGYFCPDRPCVDVNITVADSKFTDSSSLVVYLTNTVSSDSFFREIMNVNIRNTLFQKSDYSVHALIVDSFEVNTHVRMDNVEFSGYSGNLLLFTSFTFTGASSL